MPYRRRGGGYVPQQPIGDFGASFAAGRAIRDQISGEEKRREAMARQLEDLDLEAAKAEAAEINARRKRAEAQEKRAAAQELRTGQTHANTMAEAENAAAMQAAQSMEGTTPTLADTIGRAWAPQAQAPGINLNLEGTQQGPPQTVPTPGVPTPNVNLPFHQPQMIPSPVAGGEAYPFTPKTAAQVEEAKRAEMLFGVEEEGLKSQAKETGKQAAYPQTLVTPTLANIFQKAGIRAPGVGEEIPHSMIEFYRTAVQGALGIEKQALDHLFQEGQQAVEGGEDMLDIPEAVAARLGIPAGKYHSKVLDAIVKTHGKGAGGGSTDDKEKDPEKELPLGTPAAQLMGTEEPSLQTPLGVGMRELPKIAAAAEATATAEPRQRAAIQQARQELGAGASREAIRKRAQEIYAAQGK